VRGLRNARPGWGFLASLGVKGFRHNGWLAVVQVLAALFAVLTLLSGAAMVPSAQARSARVASTLPHLLPPDVQTSGVVARQTSDYFKGRHITVREFAVVGDVARPAAVPAVGQQRLSPGMRRLMQDQPLLRERYPGTFSSDLSVQDHALLGPDSLVVWRGVTRAQLPPEVGWLGDGLGRGDDVASYIPPAVVLGAGIFSVAFVIPLLLLLALLSSLGGARRQTRAQAFELLGMTSRELRMVNVVEVTAPCVVGAAAAAAAFPILSRAAAPHLPFQGGLWPDDVRLSASHVLGLAAMVPLLVAMGAWVAGARPACRETTTRHWPWRWWVTLLCLALGVVLGGAVIMEALPAGGVASGAALGSIALVSLATIGLIPRLAELLMTRGIRSPHLTIHIASRQGLADLTRTCRPAMGVATLVALSGPLLVYFPLLADTSSRDLNRLADVVGPNTLVATTQGYAPHGRHDDTVTLELVTVGTGPDHTYPAAFVDCRQWQSLVGESDGCQAGTVPRDLGSLPPMARIMTEQQHTDGSVSWVAESSPFPMPTSPVVSTAWDQVSRGLSLPPTILMPRPTGLATDTPASRTITFAPSHGDDADGLEQVRTRLRHQTGDVVLTPQESYDIATLATREFKTMGFLAADLAISVAAIATLITVADQIRANSGSRWHLQISGVADSFWRRLRWCSIMAPMAVGLIPAAAAAIFSADVLTTPLTGGGTSLPVRDIAALGAIALTVSATTVAVMLRLSQGDLNRNEEL